MPSYHRSTIDIDATVDATAEARRLIIIPTAQSQRWLDVALVADVGSSMVVWRDAIDELEKILVQVGAFRSVLRWRLSTDSSFATLHDLQGAIQPFERIIDPSGRRLVLVVTDGVGVGWYKEMLWTALERWASFMPTAILQVLPKSYWPETGVGEPAVQVRAATPGSPNSNLITRWNWWAKVEEYDDLATGDPLVPIPVLSLSKEHITRWADSIVECLTWADGVSTKFQRSWLLEDADELTALESVRLFRKRASPGAYRLAQVLATAPRLSLPLIRVLQSRLVPGTGSLELAEVFVNGLLKVDISGGDEPERCYVFRDGVRELLSSGITVLEEWDTLSAVSDYLIEEIRVPSSRALVALVADPAGRETIASVGEPFADLVGELSTHLGLREAHSVSDSPLQTDQFGSTPKLGRGGFDLRRVVKIVSQKSSATAYASGYLIADDVVLTAGRVLSGAGSVRVQCSFGLSGEKVAEADSWWVDPVTDLAVVSIPIWRGTQSVAPGQFGRIGDVRAALAVQVAGFPRWKVGSERSTFGRNDDGQDYWNPHSVVGSAAVVPSIQGHIIEMIVPPSLSADPSSHLVPWEGMSGAAVWVSDRIVGVVIEDDPSDGQGNLRAARIDCVLDQLDPAQRSALRTLLPLPETSSELLDVVPPSPPQLITTTYHAKLIDIAPNQLYDRELELDKLVWFCAGLESYAWWQAGPWAGKSALLSWFALHPPGGVDVVSFFVTKRFADQADSDSFTAALVEQLSVLTGDLHDVQMEVSAGQENVMRLLDTAARRCAEAGRRLLLIVDGIDEDTGAADANQPSIASLLPRQPPSSVRVLVTSRPFLKLPGDVPPDHPLRVISPQQLEVSPHALDAISAAESELIKLLNGPKLQRDVLGLIAASGGPLTESDLAELSKRPHYEVAQLLAGTFGRIFRPMVVDSRDEGENVDTGYIFSHEMLQQAAKRELGDDLNRYLQLIDSWAESYLARKLPIGTPTYLLRFYGPLLDLRGYLARAITYQQAVAGTQHRSAPEAMAAVGELLAKQGDVEGARSLFQRAIDTGHVDAAPRGMVGLGQLLAEQGDVEGARSLFQRAIDTGHVEARPMGMTGLTELQAKERLVEEATRRNRQERSSHAVGGRTPPSGIDLTRGNFTRIWDYFLGGKDNFPVDRDIAQEVLTILPDIADTARAQVGFRVRALQYLVDAGIRQFIDICPGLPIINATHEVVQSSAPECRIIYVDNDPMVVVHAAALLTSTPQGATYYFHAALQDTYTILSDAAQHLEITEPIALVLVGAMEHILDDDEAYAIVSHLMGSLAPGSYLALCDIAAEIDPELMREVVQRLNDTAIPPTKARTRQELIRFFEGLDLLEPGVVSASLWRPAQQQYGTLPEVFSFGGVGRKL